jgi:recombination protein RecT
MTTNLPAKPGQQTAVVRYDGSKTVQAMSAVNEHGKAVTGIAAFNVMLQARKGSIASVAASFLSPERVLKIALNNFQKSPALAKCTGDSIFRAVMQAAELGFEPGGALGQAHLVAYKETCTLLVDYKGLCDLAYRSGNISSINAFAVYEGDTFDVEYGSEPRIIHKPNFSGPRDPRNVICVYAVIRLKDGGLLTDVMSRAEVEAVRARSRASGGGPWVTDWAEMAKKTVLRRTLKRAPKSTEMQKVLALEHAADTGNFADPIFDADLIEADFIEEESPTRSRQVSDRLKTQATQGGPQWQDDGPPADMDPAQNDPDLAFGE